MGSRNAGFGKPDRVSEMPHEQDVAAAGMNAKWVTFMSLGNSVCGSPDRWAVLAKEGGDALGEVKWFGRWRGYAFYPLLDTVYEQDCLRDIAGFIEEQTKAHRAQQRTARAASLAALRGGAG